MWLLWSLFAAFLQRCLYECGVRVSLQVFYIANAKALESVEPEVFADKCEKEKTWTHI